MAGLAAGRHHRAPGGAIDLVGLVVRARRGRHRVDRRARPDALGAGVAGEVAGVRADLDLDRDRRAGRAARRPRGRTGPPARRTAAARRPRSRPARRSACGRRCRSTPPRCRPDPEPTAHASRNPKLVPVFQWIAGGTPATSRRRGKSGRSRCGQRLPGQPGGAGAEAPRATAIAIAGRRVAGDQAQRPVRAVLGERRVQPGELERRQLDAADDHRQPVLPGRGARRRHPHAGELADEALDAEPVEQVDERQVERARQRALQRDQPRPVAVEVARPVGAVLGRHVGDQELGQRQAAIDRERVEQRLERRARRARPAEHRDLPAVLARRRSRGCRPARRPRGCGDRPRRSRRRRSPCGAARRGAALDLALGERLDRRRRASSAPGGRGGGGGAATPRACAAWRGIRRSRSGGAVAAASASAARASTAANTPAAISLPRIASRRARSRAALPGRGA